eukprot:COSAG05_NODE_1577_length_4502_cov_3.764706_1_plen_88_part_00
MIDWILPASIKLAEALEAVGTLLGSGSAAGEILSPIGVLVKAGQGTLVLLGAVLPAALGARYQPGQLSRAASMQASCCWRRTCTLPL